MTAVLVSYQNLLWERCSARGALLPLSLSRYSAHIPLLFVSRLLHSPETRWEITDQKLSRSDYLIYRLSHSRQDIAQSANPAGIPVGMNAATLVRSLEEDFDNEISCEWFSF